MPKVTLEFDLPEENHEHELAINSGKYYSVLWEMDQYLRSMIKYASDEISQERIDTLQEVRDELWKILESWNLDLDK